jgi:hypothetical protein
LLQKSIKHRENTKLATQLTPINKDTPIDCTLKHHKIGMKERYTTASHHHAEESFLPST